MGYIFNRYLQGETIHHHLFRLLNFIVNKKTAQDVVPFDETVETLFEDIFIDFSFQGKQVLFAVEIDLGVLQRMKEHPFLHWGQGIYFFNLPFFFHI